jgi:hypothetical protein
VKKLIRKILVTLAIFAGVFTVKAQNSYDSAYSKARINIPTAVDYLGSAQRLSNPMTQLCVQSMLGVFNLTADSVAQTYHGNSGRDSILDTGANVLTVKAAGTVDSLYITFPKSPQNGQVFQITSSVAVTFVKTLHTGTITSDITSLAANTPLTFLWSSKFSTWFK